MKTWIKNHPYLLAFIIVIAIALIWYFFFNDKIKFFGTFATGGRVSRPVNPVNPIIPVAPVTPVNPVVPVNPVAPANTTIDVSRKQVKCVNTKAAKCYPFLPIPGAIMQFDEHFHLVSSTNISADNFTCCYSN